MWQQNCDTYGIRERAIEVIMRVTMRESVVPWNRQYGKEKIEKCLVCQANGPESHPDPLYKLPLPSKPWHTLNMDFCGPLPTGEC